MNVVGIIAEYNPMHNGHIYHIQKAKELTNADFVIVIMSGSFTEQGNISVINKMDRAEIAIQNGADLVIELPTIHAISSAENFAFGAVNILNSLGVVTHIAFGAEAYDINELSKVADIYIKHKDEIICKIKEYTKLGLNSGECYSKVLSEYLDSSSEKYTLPNNILAIEYLKSLKLLNSQIKPILIHRLESNHSDTEIVNTGKYASSTSIRNVLGAKDISKENKFKQIQEVVPLNTYEYLINTCFNSNEKLWNILKYEILKLNINGLRNIHEICEGLENKLYKQALACNSYEEFIFNVKTKRYTLSRIKRICLYIILGITKEQYITLKKANYTRVLKIKEDSLALLSKISNSINGLLITKVTDESINSLDSITCSNIKLDILAHNLLYSDNKDYTNKIIQP